MIRIYYSCSICRANEAPVWVTARTSSEIDIFTWLSAVVMPVVKSDHRNNSPGCRAENVKIRFPYNPRAKFVGEEVGEPYYQDVRHDGECEARYQRRGRCTCLARFTPPGMRRGS